MGSIGRLIGDETGADLIEYALIVGVVSLAAAAVVSSLVPAIKDVLESLADSLTGVHW